jgi:hypothetical protein
MDDKTAISRFEDTVTALEEIDEEIDQARAVAQYYRDEVVATPEQARTLGKVDEMLQQAQIWLADAKRATVGGWREALDTQ